MKHVGIACILKSALLLVSWSAIRILAVKINQKQK